MDLIVKSRGLGKTYDLIMRSAKTGAIIVTAPGCKERILEKARNVGVKIPEPIEVRGDNDLDEIRIGKPLLIDDLECFLFRMVGNVDCATVSPESVEIATVTTKANVLINTWACK